MATIKLGLWALLFSSLVFSCELDETKGFRGPPAPPFSSFTDELTFYVERVADNNQRFWKFAEDCSVLELWFIPKLKAENSHLKFKIKGKETFTFETECGYLSYSPNCSDSQLFFQHNASKTSYFRFSAAPGGDHYLIVATGKDRLKGCSNKIGFVGSLALLRSNIADSFVFFPAQKPSRLFTAKPNGTFIIDSQSHTGFESFVGTENCQARAKLVTRKHAIFLRLESTPGGFFIKTAGGQCDAYLSHNSCQNSDVYFSEKPHPFKLVKKPGGYRFHPLANNNKTCASALGVKAGNIGMRIQTHGDLFNLYELKPHQPVTLTDKGDCPDPFVWQVGEELFMGCTGAYLSLRKAQRGLDFFADIGTVLKPQNPLPVAGYFWAPEFLEWQGGSFVVFSNPQNLERLDHRIRFAMSRSPGRSESYDIFLPPPSYLELTDENGHVLENVIDPHIYQEQAKLYLLYKLNDNSNAKIYLQQIEINRMASTFDVAKIGLAVKLLEAKEAPKWWYEHPNGYDGAGGISIEGPEVVYNSGYYFLFFSTGAYVNESYTLNVARSKSITGPYEIKKTPVLTTASLGVHESGANLMGPGHPGFIFYQGEWHIFFHARNDDLQIRQVFRGKVVFSDGWPFIII